MNENKQKEAEIGPLKNKQKISSTFAKHAISRSILARFKEFMFAS